MQHHGMFLGKRRVKNSIAIILTTVYGQSEPGKICVQLPPLPQTSHMTWGKEFIHHVLPFSLASVACRNCLALERCCGTEEFGCCGTANKRGYCQMRTASLQNESPRKINEGSGQILKQRVAIKK